MSHSRPSLRPAMIGMSAALVLSSCAVTIEENFLFWVPKDIDFIDEREEAGTELFMGRALVEPMARDLTARGYWTTKVEFRLEEEDFVPTRITRDRVIAGDAELEILRVDRRDGPDDAPVFLHCAGIGQSLYNNGVQHALKLLPYGDVIQFDMPGHGLSTGEPSVATLQAAVEVVSAYAVEAAGDRPLVFYGHSLGGYICAAMAARADKADALVIEASGTDAASVARAWVPGVLRPLFRIRMDDQIAAFDIPALLGDYDGPVLAISGEDDRVMPARLVREMAEDLEATGHQVTYAEMPDRDHSTIPFAEAYDPTIRAFLNGVPPRP